MYRWRSEFRIRPEEIAASLQIAERYFPQQCGGSFMVPFPPSCTEWVKGVRSIQLVGLLPSQQIVRHADQSIAPLVRFHLPLQTNSGCWSFSDDGHWQRLDVGHVYEMDPTVPHGAVNWGETVRLHLMIDVEEG